MQAEDIPFVVAGVRGRYPKQPRKIGLVARNIEHELIPDGHAVILRICDKAHPEFWIEVNLRDIDLKGARNNGR